MKQTVVDKYTQEAAKRFGVSVFEVTPEQRRAVKALLFGETYGSSTSLGEAINNVNR